MSELREITVLCTGTFDILHGPVLGSAADSHYFKRIRIQILLVISMRIRILPFTLMRIRILPYFDADPDPDPI